MNRFEQLNPSSQKQMKWSLLSIWTPQSLLNAESCIPLLPILIISLAQFFFFLWTLEINESRYITLFVVSGSIKKLGHMMYSFTLLIPMNQKWPALVPAMCNRLSCAQMHELPQSHCGDNREGTLFSWLHIFYAHLASVRFEHSVCCESLMTNY